MLKRLFTTSLTVSLLTACSGDQNATERGGAPTTLGTRSYKLDPEAAAVQISVFGLRVGTPDEAKFRFLMRSLKTAGEFVQVFERASDTEGGGTLCGVFAATANHEEIYDLVRSIETDPKNTNFSAVSVSSCHLETK